ncbi:MAG TPA: hypothetical protein GXZ82_02835 [Firmicutes bacterium]|nr:hypothetical protein [Bacillota bacterium]
MNAGQALSTFKLPNEGPTRGDAYLQSLLAIIRYAGRPLEYDFLAGVTGDAFRATTWDAHRCCEWDTQPRMRQLKYLEEALGLQWEPIWPPYLPEAAPQPLVLSGTGMSPTDPGSDEPLFLYDRAYPTWHDDLMVKVKDAIERGYPVLVRGTWQGVTTHQWGCLVGWNQANDQFYGVLPGNKLYLDGLPELAVYIKGLADAPIQPARIFPESLRRAAMEKSPLDYPVTPNARTRTMYDIWIDRLFAPPQHATCGEEPWQCHWRLATTTRDARLAAQGFLRSARPYLPVKALSALEELDRCYAQVTRTFTRDTDPRYVQFAYGLVDEQYEMADRIALVQRYERHARQALRNLALQLDAE